MAKPVDDQGAPHDVHFLLPSGAWHLKKIALTLDTLRETARLFEARFLVTTTYDGSHHIYDMQLSLVGRMRPIKSFPVEQVDAALMYAVLKSRMV